MNLMKMTNYVAPKAEVVHLRGLSFLEYFSGNGNVEQWLDGEDLGDTEDYLP